MLSSISSQGSWNQGGGGTRGAISPPPDPISRKKTATCGICLFFCNDLQIVNWSASCQMELLIIMMMMMMMMMMMIIIVILIIIIIIIIIRYNEETKFPVTPSFVLAHSSDSI